MNLIAVVDLGSSLGKIFYTGADRTPQPLALRPEIVSHVSKAQVAAQMGEYDDPLKSAFVEDSDGILYAVGDFAADLAGRQFHQLSKWDNLTPRILAIIGLIHAELSGGLAGGFGREAFAISIGVMLPRDEINPPNRDERLEVIKRAAKRFKFRNRTIECDLKLKIATEGSGLFAAHAAYLQSIGQNLGEIDIPVIMGGERNTSLLVFRAGKLNPTLSSSDGDGFYRFADQIRKQVGGNVSLEEIIRAIAQRRDRIRVTGGGFIDLKPYLPGVMESYSNSLKSYLRAKLPPGDINVVCGGGALSLVWLQVEEWFKEQEIPGVFLGAISDDLRAIFAGRSDLEVLNSARFADALGLYLALAQRTRQQEVAATGGRW